MAYRSLLAQIDVDGSPLDRFRFSLGVAELFDAELTFFSAARPVAVVEAPKGPPIAAEIMRDQMAAIEERQRAVHAELTSLVEDRHRIHWNSEIGDPTARLTERSRIADLVVLTERAPGQANDQHRTVDIADVILSSGRPVLLASRSMAPIKAKTVVVAWKDCREARRSVLDAIPFLQRAEDVVVVTVGDDSPTSRESGVDVVKMLARHGVHARTLVIPNPGNDAGMALIATAVGLGSDLLVCGAYGHNRLMEWAFGGVTRTLLSDGRLNRLMSS